MKRLAAALLLMPGMLAAQAPRGLGLALDAPAADSAYTFERMPPGWHVTMGPGAILYDSTAVTGGRFAVESEIFLFPNSSDEGYGIVLGRNGDSWTGFLLSRNGTAAVLRAQGGVLTPLVAWTAHDSVPRPGEGPARAVLRVEVERDTVHFLANGARVAAVPRQAAAVDGAVGLRIGQGVNAHVASLDLTRRLAPPRGE
ncbi:MAG TPA: hypothetical protein VF037_09735 [Gemmatimonadales bacterium]